MRRARRFALVVPSALLALGAGPSAAVLENERRTLEDIQAVTSAMAAYQSANQGFYDWPRCLVDPASCLPGYEGPPMLSRELASLAPRHGYRRAFHLGPPAPGTMVRSASSIVSFAYTAVPLQVGVTGNRAFCVDGSGYVRESEYGASSLVTAGGRCASNRMAEEPPPRSIEEIEARVIADLRTLSSGEQAYQSANGGFYDRPQCLGAPVGCIPGYPPEGPTFLDSRIADLRERHGYHRRFHPGPPAPADQVGGASRSSLTAWAYTAVPVVRGHTGRRSFCIDETGSLCPYDGGREPGLVDGRCPPCPSRL